MTTKFKIILGFSLMVLLVAGMAVFGWLRLSDASHGFNDYRVEARTAVNGNAADALMRESKDDMSNFVLTLKPEWAARARTMLAQSAEYVKRAREVETTTEAQQSLDKQIAQLSSMSDLAKQVEDKLLTAAKIAHDKLQPASNKINDMLTEINAAARDANNDAILAMIDDAYSLFTKLEVAIGVYNATYLPEDGITWMNQISTVGAMILGASMIPFLLNVYLTARNAPKVTVNDPWGFGRSLEWATSCPPPRHNFVSIPRIRSESPAFDLNHPEVSGVKQPGQENEPALASAK